MKKFVSLLLTVLMFAAMLTVFAVPAFAEETKTAEDYLSEAAQLENAGQYGPAAAAYYHAGEVLQWAGNFASADAAYAFMKSGECYEKAEDFHGAGLSFSQAGNSYGQAGDYAAAANAYMKAGECYEKDKDFRQAAGLFIGAASSAQKKADELLNRSTGSTLSEGSLTIICTIAAAVIFGLGGFILGTKKKKKPALAGGAESDE